MLAPARRKKSVDAYGKAFTGGGVLAIFLTLAVKPEGAAIFAVSLAVAAALVFSVPAGTARPGASATQTWRPSTNPRVCYLFAQAVTECETIATQEAALRHIDQAVAIEPNNFFVWQMKGKVLKNMEEVSAAIIATRKALTFKPDGIESLAMLAELLAKEGKCDEALKVADKAIKVKDGFLVRVARGRVFMAMGKYAECELETEKALQFQSDLGTARGLHALASEKLQHWDKVIDDMNFLVKTTSEKSFSRAAVLGRRADAYLHLKQYDKAIADYTQAIKLFPDNRKMHAGLLEVYKAKGDTVGVRRETAIVDRLDGDLKMWK